MSSRPAGRFRDLRRPGRAAGQLQVDVLEGGPDDLQAGEPDDLTAALHRLTGWALEQHVELTGLEVIRPTLEDVYLELTGGPAGAAEVAEPAGRPGGHRS